MQVDHGIRINLGMVHLKAGANGIGNRRLGWIGGFKICHKFLKFIAHLNIPPFSRYMQNFHNYKEAIWLAKVSLSPEEYVEVRNSFYWYLIS